MPNVGSPSLQYQPTRSAEYYRPRVKPRPVALPIAALFFVCVLLLLGGTYGYWQGELTQMVLQAGLPIAAGIIVGLGTGIVLQYGRLRRPIIGTLAGVMTAVIFLYAAWNLWIIRITDQSVSAPFLFDLMTHPREVKDLIVALNEIGTLSRDRRPISGPLLWMIWGAEATIIIVASAVVTTFVARVEDPVACDACRSTAKRAEHLPRFRSEEADQIVAIIHQRRFADLAALPRLEHDDDPEVKLSLYQCPDCDHFNVLYVTRLGWTVSTEGNVSVQTNKLVDGLRVTPEEAKTIIGLREVTSDIEEDDTDAEGTDDEDAENDLDAPQSRPNQNGND